MFNFSNFHKPLYYVRINLTRNYAFKVDQLVKWVRPEKIPSIKPEQSGDLTPLGELPFKEIAHDFKKCPEIESANDYVKRLFTYEFFPRKYVLAHKKEELMDSVRSHKLDISSRESKIAQWTIKIRNLQECMEKYPSNKRMKHFLKELIEKRKRNIRLLRSEDYKKYEWLLERLSLIYIPEPLEPHKVSRKDSVRRLTDIYCENIRQQKLQDYKELLDSQKEDFLKGKIAILEKIMEDEKSFGLSPSITQEDIDSTVKRLKELELNSKEKSI